MMPLPAAAPAGPLRLLTALISYCFKMRLKCSLIIPTPSWFAVAVPVPTTAVVAAWCVEEAVAAAPTLCLSMSGDRLIDVGVSQLTSNGGDVLKNSAQVSRNWLQANWFVAQFVPSTFSAKGDSVEAMPKKLQIKKCLSCLL